MSTETLFAKALGLPAPWKVTKVVSFSEEKRLDITVDFPCGSTFNCPVCGAPGAKSYDTCEEEWQHLNFPQYTTYLHIRVPRVKCRRGPIGRWKKDLGCIATFIRLILKEKQTAS